MDPTSLFDTLSGAAGTPIDRSKLNLGVATAQAQNGLRTAQTDDAIGRAVAAQRQNNAEAAITGPSLASALGLDAADPKAAALANIVQAHAGADFSAGSEGLLHGQQFANRNVLGDVSKLNTPEQTAAMQAVEGKIATPEAVADNYALPAGVAAPNILQTPEGAAKTAAAQALVPLRADQGQAALQNANTRATKAAAAPGAGMDDDSLMMLAHRYVNGEKMNDLGLTGNKSADDRAKVISYAARLAADPTWVPPSFAGSTGHVTADQAAGVGDAQAGRTANSRNLNQLTQKAGLVDAAEQTANKNLQLAGQKLQAADQSGSPLLNRLSNLWANNVTGDPDVAAYQNSLIAARTEYARVVSMATGAAGITKAAMEEGKRLFPDGMAPQQFLAALPVAQQEMANRTAGLHEQIAAAKRGIHGATSADSSAPAPSAAATAMPPPAALQSLQEGHVTTFGNGQKWTLQGGKPVQVP